MIRILISIILIVLGISLLISHVDTVTGLFSLNSVYRRDTLTSEILDPDNKTFISGEFIATYNNLNKLAIRLYIPNDFNQGEITFRLKKTSQDAWYYETNYKVNSLNANNVIDFDFPPIGESGGKTFKFEIDYHGKHTDGLIVPRTGDFVYSSRYDYFHNTQFSPDKLIYFLTKKVAEILAIPGIYTYFAFVFLPFTIFFFSLTKKCPGTLIALTGLFVIFDLTGNKENIDISTLIIFIIWIILIVDGLIRYEIPALIALVPLSVLIFIQYFRFDAKITEAATWSYIFLFLSGIDYIYMSLTKPKIERGLLQLSTQVRVEYKFILSILNKIPPLIYKTSAIGLIIKLLWSISSSFNDTNSLYLYYFRDNHYHEFLARTGWLLIFQYLLLIPIFISFATKSKQKLLVTLMFCLTAWKCQGLIIDNTTLFKNAVAIVNIRPNNINEPWVDVTIQGHNFNDLPFYGVVYVDGKKQRIISWTNREIIFRTDPTFTKSGDIYIKNYSEKISNKLNFIYNGNR